MAKSDIALSAITITAVLAVSLLAGMGLTIYQMRTTNKNVQLEQCLSEKEQLLNQIHLLGQEKGMCYDNQRQDQ